MKTKLIAIFLSVAVVLLLPGCGTTPQEKIQSAATIARFCAFNASSAYMIEADNKDEAKANLRREANDFRALESVDTVRIADVALIASKLPAEKLKSAYGRLALMNGQLFLITWSNSSELKDVDAKPVATALREGIEMEIGPPEVLQRASTPVVPVFTPTN